MVCLDTDIIINALRNKGNIGQKLIEIKQRGLYLSTTSVNTFELFNGVKEIKWEKELISLNNFLSGLNILDFDFESSKKAAEIFNILKEKGSSLDIADVMVAAIAITNNQSLLTENKKHFDRIEGLTLEVI